MAVKIPWLFKFTICDSNWNINKGAHADTKNNVDLINAQSCSNLWKWNNNKHTPPPRASSFTNGNSHQVSCVLEHLMSMQIVQKLLIQDNLRIHYIQNCEFWNNSQWNYENKLKEGLWAGFKDLIEWLLCCGLKIDEFPMQGVQYLHSTVTRPSFL